MAFWVPIERDVVTVTGPDAASYLHSQLSQDVGSMQPGDVRQSFLLEPNGRIVALVRVTAAARDRFVLDSESGTADAIVARLGRFKIRVSAEIESRRQTWRAVRDLAPGEAARIEAAIPAWRGDGTAVDLFSPGAEPPEWVREGSADDFEFERVRAAWPAWGREITGESIPAESGVVESAVSFTKGCYPGQELVERMDSRGTSAPRVVVALRCAAGTDPGDDVVLDGDVVGVFTSVAHRGDEWIALARVRRGVDLERIARIVASDGA